jgi:hypothetical protein
MAGTTLCALATAKAEQIVMSTADTLNKRMSSPLWFYYRGLRILK